MRSITDTPVLVVAAVLMAGSLTGCATDSSPAVEAIHLPAPHRYECGHVSTPLVIDGRLDDAAWAEAPSSSRFVDIEGSRRPRPRFDTWMKMLWDDEHLYVAAWMEEPHVWGTLTEHDQIVFHDNDFEVFIDPDGDTREYYEIEVNTLNTIFDLYLPKTYRSGGKADHDWNCPGLQTAVHVDGTLNDPRDIDRAWSVEIAIPWAALAPHANRPAPPEPGDEWRINFSRVEWHHVIRQGRYEKVEGLREDNWVWTPQGVIDMHVPERWGYVTFRAEP